MGETAASAVDTTAEETEGAPGSSTEAAAEENPLTFIVGDGKTQEEKPDAEDDGKPAEPAPKAESSDIDQKLEEMKAENARLQALVNKKFYELRQQKKAAKEGEEAKPAFTDAQLLKILEEHQGEPAVLLQVMKHMTEAGAVKAEKAAVDTAEIKQHQAQVDAWLHQNVPDLYEEGSQRRAQTDEIKSKLRLDAHPMGDFLSVAAAMLASYPDMIAKAQEEGRKKALSEASEAGRKKAVAGAAPAGGKSKAAAGAAGDADFIQQGKAMNLTGSALALYVQMRKNASKPSRQVMEA